MLSTLRANRPLSYRLAQAALALAFALFTGNPLFAGGLPETCLADCSVAYGAVLGVAPGQVPAYSNCSADCISMEPNYLDGNFMGVGWQCVEFARRWLYENKGLTFPSIRNAADIWPDVDALLPVGGGRPVTLTAHPNGDSTAPAKDDLLLYAETFLGTGHVAIITEVDLEQGWVRVAEQNFDNRPWIGSYARQIPLRTEHGMYWLEGEDVIGWKHIPPAGE